MKKKAHFILLMVFIFLIGLFHAQERFKDFPVLKGSYLGQKPPGMTPEIFAPGILSRFSMLHGKIVFSPDGLEAFWTCNAAPVQSRWTARQSPPGIWTAPEQSVFSLEYIENSMAYSADGKRLYFHSRRPLQGTGAPKDKDIWIREKTSKGWGDPVPLGPPVNLPTWDESAPSLAADGTLFFSRQEYTGGHGAPGHGAAQIDIYYSEWKNGAYTEPVRMGPEINSESPELDPVIAPDKSYLLFTSARPDGYSRMMNLYVSFRTGDGRWTLAQCLSHTLKIDNIWFPSLSVDGAYLFFCGGYPSDKGYTDSRYYWVDTRIIESLRPSIGIPGEQLEISQEERNGNELQPPDKVMDAAGVRAGMAIGEVGAGKGRYTVYLARRVGPEGKVYANDVDEKSIAFLKDRCRKQGLANIETVLGTTDNPCFPKGQLDMVFMTWVYHHLTRPVALLRNLIPSLKPGGTVVIVDPDPTKNRGGRSPENRSPDQIRREAKEAGFEVVRIETFLKLDNLYILKVRE